MAFGNGHLARAQRSNMMANWHVLAPRPDAMQRVIVNLTFVRGMGEKKKKKEECSLAKIFYSLSLAAPHARARARARDGDARATAPRVSIVGILAIMHRVCNTISRD